MAHGPFGLSRWWALALGRRSVYAGRVRLSRRGMASVEYMLLLCSMLTVTCLTGYFLKNMTSSMVDRLADKILNAAFSLGR